MKKFFVYHRVVINDTQCLYTHLVHLVSQPLCVFSLQLVGKIKTRKYHSGFLPLLIAHVCLLSSEHLTSVQTNLNSAKSLVGGSLSLTVFFRLDLSLSKIQLWEELWISWKRKTHLNNNNIKVLPLNGSSPSNLLPVTIIIVIKIF